MIITGLSGNEIYCLAQKGFAPGNVVVGNSVRSLGVLGGVSSSFKTLSGGEITNLTQLITEGRHAAIGRMEKEAQEKGAHGVTGVTSNLKTLSGLQEFIAVGSAVSALTQTGPLFTTACSGQDLYCQMDSGYAIQDQPPARQLTASNVPAVLYNNRNENTDPSAW